MAENNSTERQNLLLRLVDLLDRLLDRRVAAASCVDLIELAGTQLHPKLLAAVAEADRVYGCPPTSRTGKRAPVGPPEGSG